MATALTKHLGRSHARWVPIRAALIISFVLGCCCQGYDKARSWGTLLPEIFYMMNDEGKYVSMGNDCYPPSQCIQPRDDKMVTSDISTQWRIYVRKYDEILIASELYPTCFLDLVQVGTHGSQLGYRDQPDSVDRVLWRVRRTGGIYYLEDYGLAKFAPVGALKAVSHPSADSEVLFEPDLYNATVKAGLMPNNTVYVSSARTRDLATAAAAVVFTTAALQTLVL
eukprot:TRINITY_DN76371_c0_g1_i1.p1 TRINITY_DN76371_c0_g1~~TRINITY_DN76371_c0_g1_i1.p1  ORF type:complete len:225 (-),score=21.08 TRINITY_DN76371_c0_g1_i1:268-942(-)